MIDINPNGAEETLLNMELDEIPITLKRCPFCGRIAWMGGSENVNGHPYYYVACTNMNCGATTFGAETKREAMEKWNRRKEQNDEID